MSIEEVAQIVKKVENDEDEREGNQAVGQRSQKGAEQVLVDQFHIKR